MTDAAGRGWIVIRFSATALWLPEQEAGELFSGVNVSITRVAGPAESAWEPGALLPADHWTGVRTSGDPGLVPDCRFRPERDVALVKLPGSAPPDRRLALLGGIDEYIGERGDIPGIRTQTIRGPGGLRMGLHLDNWDRKTAGRRAASRNRASLNLSAEPRWFMFVDHDVVAGHPPDQVPSTETARRVIDHAPKAPTVVRLKVPKDWAYVAPTENLLHDSWSIGQRRGARHASALGNFSPQHGGEDGGVIAVDGDASMVVERMTT